MHLKLRSFRGPGSPAKLEHKFALTVILSLASSSAFAPVGFVNVPVSANRYHLIKNPLSAYNGTSYTNTLNGALANSVPAGTKAWIWDVTNQVFLGPSKYLAGSAWSTNYAIPVGKGFMLQSPVDATITFVGEVLQGALTNFVAGTNKLSLLGSMVPQSGLLSGVLGFPPSDGDSVYQFSPATQQYLDGRTYFSGYGWFTNEPTISVAEGFFVQHSGPDKIWLRNFTVQRPADPAPSPESTPEIDNCSIRDGIVTLKISKATKRYNVQFSTDRVNWTNLAVNQTAAVWKGPLPPGPFGFFQVVKP